MLLLAMPAWAEIALAPMLAMHAGHMRPGHEMAADMPGHHQHHQDAKAQEAPALPCCPGFHGTPQQTALTLTAATPACDDPHTCCFRQGPQSVPAPVHDVQQSAREIAPKAVAEIPPPSDSPQIEPPDSTLSQSPPADVLGMTLRV